MLAALYSDIAVQKNSVFSWNVQSILHIHTGNEIKNYTFMILNTPIINPETVLSLWKNSNLRIVVDGGGNQLYEVIKKLEIDEIYDFLPHFVIGDLDSISDNVLQFYKQRNTKIIKIVDQNKTDFYKALEIVPISSENDNVIVYCDNIGRFDHIMGNINVLYSASTHTNLKRLNVYLLGNNCLTWLLRPGCHKIQIPDTIWSEKSYCGLIPIGKPCKHVSTTGLKWNLIDDVLQFGGLVSSCNTYDESYSEPIITVDTDSALIWTMTINVLFEQSR